MTKLSCSIFGKAASTLVGLAMCVGLWSVDANAQQPAPSVEQGVAPKPALWRFSDEDSTLWIFGSVHLLDPDLKWRRPELEKALAEVEYVYFEAPLDYFSQAKAQMIVLGIFGFHCLWVLAVCFLLQFINCIFHKTGLSINTAFPP